MKKQIALLLSLGVLFSVGCSAKSNEVADQSSSEAQKPKTEIQQSKESKSITIPEDISVDSYEAFLETLTAPKQYYVEAVGVTNYGGQEVTMEQKTWCDGDRMRIEMTNTMNKEKSISITDGKYDYMYNEKTKKGMKSAWDSEDTDPMMADPTMEGEEDTEESPADYRAIRPEVLNGKPVLYVEEAYTPEDEQEEIMKTWISVEHGYPAILKAESWIGGEKISTTEVKVFKPGAVDAKMFEIPADVEFAEY